MSSTSGTSSLTSRVPDKSHLISASDDAQENVNGEIDADDTKKHKFSMSARRKVLLVTHFNLFLYSTCFWIQTGTLPYLSKKLGLDPLYFGYLQTTFALVQLLGGPLFGRIGDMFGSRTALLMAFSSAALSYCLLGFSYTVPLLFLSRLPSILMHAMQGGQMIVTDIALSSERADAMGKIGVSYGVGMVIGPLLGGWVTKVTDEQSAAFVACAGSLLSIVLVQMFIPARTKPNIAIQESNQQTEKSSSGETLLNWTRLKSVFSNKETLYLFFIKAGTGLPLGIFQSMTVVVALETFQLTPMQNGFLMAYIGTLSIAVSGLGIGFLTKRFAEVSILTWATFLLIWGYLCLVFVNSIVTLLIACLPLCVGLCLKNVIITSSLTRTVSPSDTGFVLGLNMAVNALIRTVSPTIAGIMLVSLGFSSIGYVGVVMSSAVFATILMYPPTVTQYTCEQAVAS